MIAMEPRDGLMVLVIPDPDPEPTDALKGPHNVHCPACGRYSREAADGLPDCTRHGVQEVAF